MRFSPHLPLLLAGSLCLGACNSLPAQFYDSVNTTLHTQLPDVNGAAPGTDDMRLFSFRVITPVDNVNLFSIMQAAGNEPIVPNQQNTLPIAQLSIVKVAKDKIYSHDFLNPGEATTLAFDAARQYAWDPEVARLVMVEILKIYAQRRDADVTAFRKLAEERAQYFIAKNQAAQTEYNDQAKAAVKNYFNGIPVTTAEQEAARQKQLADQASFRKNYAEYSQRKIEENKRAQDEYAKQAKAALDKYLQQLDDATKKAREKEKEAQALRKAQFDQILANQKLADFSVKDLSPDKPYALVTLTNGDFMLESNQPLPALIELQVDGIQDPVAIPVLPQTAHGRLLISINQDAQGHPIVLGGMDADTGAQFDVNQVMFKIQTGADGKRSLEFLYPDGHSENLDVAQLENLTSDTALQQLKPEVAQLDGLALEQRRALFSQIHYQLTPELEYLPPAEALDILNSVTDSLPAS